MGTGRRTIHAPAGAPVRGGESRVAKRAKSRLLARYGTTVLEKTAFTKNVSESGLFLHTNQVYRPGTTVQLQVQFPDRSFNFWGRVVWAKQVPPQLAHILECGMGIRFIEPSAEWLDFYEAWKTKRFGSP